jgi:hypothetical protein
MGISEKAIDTIMFLFVFLTHTEILITIRMKKVIHRYFRTSKLAPWGAQKVT